MRAILDTNILVDYLRGIAEAKVEVAAYDDPAISVITWIEVFVGAADADEEVVLRAFLSRFSVIGLSPEVAERAARLRRAHRLRLPDAVIWATAQVEECLLSTRNTRDFPASDPSIRVPYQIPAP
jgi:hypothetical protein